MPNPFALPEGMALFTFHGRVVRGKRLGSRLGFPTANIAYDPQSRTWPREGVYVGVAQLDGESRGYRIMAARMANFWILPVTVRGNSRTKRTWWGNF